MGSTLIFGGFIFLLVYRNYGSLDLTDPLSYIPLTLAAVLFPIANFLFTKELRSINKVGDLKNKLQAYQSAHIKRIALIEVVGFVSAIISLLTSTLENYLIFLLAIVYLTFFFPTSERVATQLELSQSERLRLDD